MGWGQKNPRTEKVGTKKSPDGKSGDKKIPETTNETMVCFFINSCGLWRKFTESEGDKTPPKIPFLRCTGKNTAISNDPLFG